MNKQDNMNLPAWFQIGHPIFEIIHHQRIDQVSQPQYWSLNGTRKVEYISVGQEIGLKYEPQAG